MFSIKGILYDYEQLELTWYMDPLCVLSKFSMLGDLKRLNFEALQSQRNH